MVTIKDIAKIVASQHNIKVAEAEEFVQKLVDTINEGLEVDRLVKIKGFGTFKMQAMKSRASVNVNTGERVIIGEHDRITFLPDAMMKNAINKPFAHFETVEIDDESPLLDEMTPVDDTDDSLDEEQEEILDEPKVETKDEPQKEPKKEVKPAEKVEAKVEEKPVALSIDDDGIAAIYGFSRYNNATSTPSVQPQTVVVDTVSRDTANVDTTIVKNEGQPVVENDDTTSVSPKKSRRHGRKYRRHRRRR